jgi:hypothetical protein
MDANLSRKPLRFGIGLTDADPTGFAADAWSWGSAPVLEQLAGT